MTKSRYKEAILLYFVYREKMRDITRDEIRRAFGEKTFAKGLEYFKNGYVETGVKRGE